MLGGTLLVAGFGTAICIPLRDFFPFGAGQRDSALPRNDDGSSPAINLSVTFPYFDKNYRVVYVSRYYIENIIVLGRARLGLIIAWAIIHL